MSYWVIILKWAYTLIKSYFFMYSRHSNRFIYCGSPFWKWSVNSFKSSEPSDYLKKVYFFITFSWSFWVVSTGFEFFFFFLLQGWPYSNHAKMVKKPCTWVNLIGKKDIEDFIKHRLIITVTTAKIFIALKAANVKPPNHL